MKGENLDNFGILFWGMCTVRLFCSDSQKNFLMPFYAVPLSESVLDEFISIPLFEQSTKFVMEFALDHDLLQFISLGNPSKNRQEVWD